MKHFLQAVAVALVCASLALAQSKPMTTIQVQNNGSPVGTLNGFVRLNFVSGCTASYSAGSFAITCSGGGSGTVNSGTINQLGLYSATGTAIGGDSLFTDNGTTAAYTGTGGITSNGGFSSSGASGAGQARLGQGTEVSPPAGYVTFMGPATVSTAFGIIPPGAPAGDTNSRPGIYALDGTGNEVLSFGTQTNTAGTEYQTATGALTNGDFCVFNATFDCTNSGILASNLVRKDTTNAAAAAMTLDLSAITTAAGFKIPVAAACTSSADGAMCYDSTAKNTHARINGADALVVEETSAAAQNRLLKSGSASLAQAQASTIIDNGTTITSTELATFGNTVRLTADSSSITATTAATATTVFTLPALTASTNYSIHCSGTTVQATAGGGIGISITFGTTAPTNAELHAVVSTSVTAMSVNSTGSISTTTATAIYPNTTAGTVTTQLPWTIDGGIEVGATAPASIVIGFYSASSSDGVVVKRDSYCHINS